MTGQPKIERNQLEPALLSVLNLLTTGLGASGTVLTVTAGSNLAWQNPPSVPTLYLGTNSHPSSMSDVSINQTSLAAGHVLQYTGTQWVNVAGGGTLSSVGIAGSTGLAVAGSPLTTNGTITLTLSSELQGLSGLSSTGFVQRTGAGTYTAANLTAAQVGAVLLAGTGIGITIASNLVSVTNTGVTSVAIAGSTGLAVSGSPVTTTGTITLTLGAELQGLSTMSTTGIVSRTAVGTYANRTLTVSGSDISISNPDGVSGNPTLSLSTTGVTAGTYTLSTVSVSGTGRVTAASNGSVALSGDVSGTIAGTTSTVSLVTSGVTAGTYGDATDVPVITVDAKGRVTSATTKAINFPVTQTVSGTANQISVSSSSGNFTVALATNTVIPTPSAGVALSATGANNANVLTLVSGNSATTATADVRILRAGSTANVALEGPSLEFYDSTNSNATLIQNSGGQTEIYQSISGGGWSRVLYIGSGGTVFVPNQLQVNGAMNFATNTWNLSTEGQKRLYFGTNADSYYEAGGGYHHFRNGSDSDIVTIDMSGNIVANGNVTGGSDIALKTEIQSIKDALYKVQQLNGVTFLRKAQTDGKRNMGLIAQDVEKVAPEAVGQSADGFKTLAYGNLAGLFVEAIKELITRVEAIEQRLSGVR